jgi:hypothetical protein
MVNWQNWWHLEIIDGCREVRQTVLMDVLAAGGSWTLILKLSSGWSINIPPLLPTWAPHPTNNPRYVTITNLTIMLKIIGLQINRSWRFTIAHLSTWSSNFGTKYLPKSIVIPSRYIAGIVCMFTFPAFVISLCYVPAELPGVAREEKLRKQIFEITWRDEGWLG